MSRYRLILLFIFVLFPTFANLNNWSYRIPVTIAEHPGTDLMNYKVPIVLDTSSLIAKEKMNEDCSDIRIVGEDKNHVPFWIEGGCNSNRTEIWARIPKIPANKVTRVYIYYGNPSATSKSNQSEVADIYKSFDSLDEISIVKGGNGEEYEISTNEKIEGKGSLHQYDTKWADNGDSYAYFPFTFQDCLGVYASFWVRPDTYEEYPTHGNGLIFSFHSDDKGLNGRLLDFRDTNHKFYICGSSCEEVSSYSDLNWYFVELYIYGRKNIIVKINGEQKFEGDIEWNSKDPVKNIEILRDPQYNNNPRWMDELLIFKWNDPEPSITVGLEETPLILKTSFPESWRYVAVEQGRYDGDLQPCGNFTRWGNWTFIGEGCYVDDFECDTGETDIGKLFHVKNLTDSGCIDIDLKGFLALKGKWDKSSIADLSSGWVLIENETIYVWNGTDLKENSVTSPKELKLCNYSIEFFFYNISKLSTKEWARDVEMFEGELIADTEVPAGERWSGAADLIYVKASSTVQSLGCSVNGKYGTVFVETGTSFDVQCDVDARVIAVNITRTLGGIAAGKKHAIITGLGNIENTNGSVFFKVERLEGEGNKNISIMGKVVKTIYVDELAPDVSVEGSRNLITYGGCASGNLTPYFYDKNLAGAYFEIPDSNNQKFCNTSNYSFRAWAIDATGKTSEVTGIIFVGNATHKINGYFIPVQEWNISGSGEKDIVWVANLTFRLEGHVSGDLNYSVLINERRESFTFNNVKGPWTKAVQYKFSNETVNITKTEGWISLGGMEAFCFLYELPRKINYRATLAAPEHDPKEKHSEGFYFDGTYKQFAEKGIKGSWKVKYEGNATRLLVCTFPGKEPDFEWCGDGKCQENCHSCPADCGACHTSSGSGGSTRIYTANINRPVNTSENTTNTTLEITATENLSVQNITNITEPLQPVVIEINRPGEIVIENDSRVRVAEGLALSDGEKFYVGEFLLGRGKYEVVNTTDAEPEELEVNFWRSLLNLLVGILRAVF